MKAYLINGSPNCRKVQATIAHLGLDIETEFLDIFKGDLKKDDYLGINPNALVPALVDGDLKLWESNAIVQYLADKAGADSLFPKNPQQRIDIIRWQFWEAIHFNKAAGTLVWEYFAKPILNLGDPDKELVEQGIKDFHRYAPILDQHLKDKDFVAGNNVTIADFSMACLADEWDTSHVPYQGYKNIVAWIDRMNNIEAWKVTAPPSLDEIGKAVNA